MSIISVIQENAHFYMCEMLLAAIEQLKWKNSLRTQLSSAISMDSLNSNITGNEVEQQQPVVLTEIPPEEKASTSSIPESEIAIEAQKSTSKFQNI